MYVDKETLTAIKIVANIEGTTIPSVIRVAFEYWAKANKYHSILDIIKEKGAE